MENDGEGLLWAFRIRSFLWPPRFYKTLAIDGTTPLTGINECPGGCGELSTVCTFVGGGGSPQIRVGECPRCGYVGYQDRPEKRWVQNFYRETWDKASKHRQTLEQDVARYKFLGARAFARELLEGVSPDRSRPVLEIGCGWGRMLAGFKDHGFSTLLGIENSPHRGEVARRAFGLSVLDAAPFEDKKIQEKLQSHAPFSLIFSNHVIEHVYDPAEVIGLCARLQRAGDYLAVNVPNVESEPIGTVLFYLPHLHGFTPVSLARVFERVGYRIVRNTSSRGEVSLVGEKTGNDGITSSLPTLSVSRVLPPLSIGERFARGLGAGERYSATRRILWWFRKLDYGRQEGALASLMTWPQWIYLSKYRNVRMYRKLLSDALGEEVFLRHPAHTAGIIGAVVENVESRFTTRSESPLEIQYPGDIQLLYK